MGRAPAARHRIQFIEPTGTRTLDAFPGFLGGMSVTLGDVNGDGVADVIAGAGPGGGPHVRVFSGTDLTELANFYAFDPAFGGGVRVAAGDVDGDGLADIIAGAGPGGGPHVRVFSGGNLSELASFYAYDPTFTGGVTVAAGDVDGDGRADIVTGAGAGGGPHVRVLSGLDSSELASFYAYDPAFEGGVFVAAGDIDGDGLSDVVAGAGPGGGPHVRVFSGLDLRELAGFYAYDPAFEGGVLVATGDIDGDGRVDLILGALDQQVRILSGVDLSELASFFAPPGMGEGISVGSSGDSVGLRFTSPATTTFRVGSAGTFTVTTEGGPGTVTLSATGTLPNGVTFTDAGDGTATLSGTPAAGAAGTYPLTITATHGTRTVTQVFTLTVSAVANQPPQLHGRCEPDGGRGRRAAERRELGHGDQCGAGGRSRSDVDLHRDGQHERGALQRAARGLVDRHADLHRGAQRVRVGGHHHRPARQRRDGQRRRRHVCAADLHDHGDRRSTIRRWPSPTAIPWRRAVRRAWLRRACLANDVDPDTPSGQPHRHARHRSGQRRLLHAEHGRQLHLRARRQRNVDRQLHLSGE